MFLLQYILPSYCYLCLAKTEFYQPICIHCKDNLPYLKVKQLNTIRKNYLKLSMCYLKYDYPMPEIINAYKHRKVKSMARVFIELFYELIQKNRALFENTQIITTIPLNQARLKQRGFDHMELIAQNLAKKLKIPYVQTIKRVKNTLPQALLENDTARRKNVKNAFELIKDKTKNNFIKDKNIIVLEDIITSGATVESYLSVLNALKPKGIYFLSLTKAR